MPDLNANEYNRLKGFTSKGFDVSGFQLTKSVSRAFLPICWECPNMLGEAFPANGALQDLSAFRQIPAADGTSFVE